MLIKWKYLGIRFDTLAQFGLQTRFPININTPQPILRFVNE